ncbi:MAG: MlrC C-terminal domain-containing protein, partial [Kiloniellaceae bacterium]
AALARRSGKEETRLLCVKAKNHFRAAFAPLCRTLIDIDAPGPACLKLESLPFEHAPGLGARARGRGGRRP